MGIKLLAAAWILLAAPAWPAEPHSAQGIMLEVDPARHAIVVSCDEIPGYMGAMVMPFTVRGPANLNALLPGMSVRFEMLEGKDAAFAEHLEVVHRTNYEAEPTEAARLTFLHRTLDPAGAAKIVQVGQPVPDFALTDQAQHVTRLSEFKNKVVALTFTYSRCPNPSYCFRLSNNLSILARRFHARAAGNLVLVTIVIDPDQDRGKALQRYADTWKADPQAWHFLTGTLDEVRQVAESFGMDFWSDEGFLTHTFHTVVIDREGRLAANLEGNQFTAQQLGDLVESVMNRPLHVAAGPPSR